MEECDKCICYSTKSGMFEKWGYCTAFKKERRWNDARAIGCFFFTKRPYGMKRGKLEE